MDRKGEHEGWETLRRWAARANARVSVRVRKSVVASSLDYFERHAIPRTQQDLTDHRCINQRMPISGDLYVWNFERWGRKINVRADGPLLFNTAQPQVDAALAGLGIALLPEGERMPQIASGSLVRVLGDWCPKFTGYHLYYPSRRQPSPAFSLVVEALRSGGPDQG